LLRLPGRPGGGGGGGEGGGGDPRKEKVGKVLKKKTLRPSAGSKKRGSFFQRHQQRRPLAKKAAVREGRPAKGRIVGARLRIKKTKEKNSSRKGLCHCLGTRVRVGRQGEQRGDKV